MRRNPQPMQAAVAYYCGGWAIRTTLQALCRLEQRDQPLIAAFEQTFADKPEQPLPEAFLTEERSRGKLLYVKQPIFDAIMAIEQETRRHFSDILHIHSNSYDNLCVSLQGSVALRTQWCSACIIVDIPVSEEADMALISSMYTKLITKWMHIRQKEMLALFASKAKAPQHADAL